jgi:signal transduction histidine kinase
MPPLTMYRKGLILVSVPLVAQLGFTWLVAEIQQTSAVAQGWSLHSKEVLEQSQVVIRALLDTQTGTRGYAFAGDPAFAAPYRQGIRETPAALEKLQNLVADNPSQSKRAVSIARKSSDLLDWYSHVVELIEAGHLAKATELVRGGDGEKQMEVVRQELATFLEEEKRLDALREQSLAALLPRQKGLLIGGSVIAFVVTVVLATVFSRGISSRLGVVTENVERLARSQPLQPPLPGSDEISSLDRAFRGMADDLARASQELRSLNRELEERVAARTAELGATNRELVHKNQEVETFVYSVSHDLRSPLVNLQGFSKELDLTLREVRLVLADERIPSDLHRKALGLVDQDMVESIRFIQTGVLRLSSIIDALLRLSRAGRVEFHPERIDVRSMIERVVDSLRGTIDEKKVEIVLGELPAAWADPSSLEQVFANLIGNALKYLDPSRPGRIEIGSLARKNGTAECTYFVRDNGLGIPAAGLEKVFQAFQRMHPDVAPGEGMGLAIVRRVLERSHGRVWVESQPGQGSTFFVALPDANANGADAGRRALQESRS